MDADGRETDVLLNEARCDVEAPLARMRGVDPRTRLLLEGSIVGTGGRGKQEPLDADWLRQLVLEAGADDVGFVEIDRPELAGHDLQAGPPVEGLVEGEAEAHAPGRGPRLRRKARRLGRLGRAAVLAFAYRDPRRGELVTVEQAVRVWRIGDWTPGRGHAQILCWGIFPSGLLRHPVF
jgi:hypothetical protein